MTAPGTRVSGSAIADPSLRDATTGAVIAAALERKADKAYVDLAVADGVAGAGGLNDRGGWSTATTYAVGDVVTQTGMRWAAKTAHTSASAFTTDLSRWTKLDPAPGPVNVMAAPYNATGNGTTDDTSAFTAALQDAYNAGGGTVYAPAGRYRIVNTALVCRRGVNLVGGGGGADGGSSYGTRFLTEGVNARIEIAHVDENGGSRGGLTGSFAIVGNGTPTYGLKVNLAVGRTLADIDVKGTVNGYLVRAAQNNLFSQMTCENLTGDGWILDESCGGNTFLRIGASASGGWNLVFRQSVAASGGAYAAPTDNHFYSPIFERHNTVTGTTQGMIYCGSGIHNYLYSPVISGLPTSAQPLVKVDRDGGASGAGSGTSVGLFLINPSIQGSQAHSTGIDVAAGCSVMVLGYPKFQNLLNAYKAASGATIFVDTTPLLASVTNYFGGGGGNQDTVIRNYQGAPVSIGRQVVGDGIIYSAVAGEAGSRLKVQADGKILWGSGATFSYDTSLYRQAADVLATDDVFFLGNQAAPPASPSGGVHLYAEGGELKYKSTTGVVATLGTSSAVQHRYRFTPSRLPKWQKARARVRNGGGDAKILAVGDSTVKGAGTNLAASDITRKSWPASLVPLLNGDVLPAAVGLGVPVNPAGSATADGRWTTGTGWALAVPFGWGNSSDYKATAGASGALVYADPNVSADRFDVYYLTSPGLGTMSVTATGGSASSVSTSAAAGVAKVTVSAAGVATSNSVSITHTSGGDLHIVGVEPWLSTTSKVRVGNAGVGGTTSGNWNAQPTTFGGIPCIKAYAPDLTVICLGINDASAASAVAGFSSNIQALATAAAISGDVVLMSMIPSDPTAAGGNYGTWEPQYVAALAAMTDYPFLDVYGRAGSYTAWSGLGFMADIVHGNDLSYWDIAAFVEGALVDF